MVAFICDANSVVTEAAKAEVRERTSEHFPPELLNRLDAMLVFSKLSQSALLDVVALRLNDFPERLTFKDRRITLDVNQVAREWLLKKEYSEGNTMHAPSSEGSVHDHDVEVPVAGPSRISWLPDVQPDAHREESHATVEPPRRSSRFNQWPAMKTRKKPSSDWPAPLPRESHPSDPTPSRSGLLSRVTKVSANGGGIHAQTQTKPPPQLVPSPPPRKDHDSKDPLNSGRAGASEEELNAVTEQQQEPNDERLSIGNALSEVCFTFFARTML
ncbi:hypothetical protein JVT61DRAFT_5862 [Boletus reticuloceps]|uniref:Uncharacterized protein n=1 Tax=Boletus reticuloceps TaxID=495285 RepID=A0A8I2YKW1_9AGAM|nr:hypothetical protein JVT61DRAFT_5862 [Boletus reticuloceps]